MVVLVSITGTGVGRGASSLLLVAVACCCCCRWEVDPAAEKEPPSSLPRCRGSADHVTVSPFTALLAPVVDLCLRIVAGGEGGESTRLRSSSSFGDEEPTTWLWGAMDHERSSGRLRGSSKIGSTVSVGCVSLTRDGEREGGASRASNESTTNSVAVRLIHNSTPQSMRNGFLCFQCDFIRPIGPFVEVTGGGA